MALKPSPSLVGSLVYLSAEDGRTFIFALADRFELLQTCMIDETQAASFAFADGRIYIRGGKHLFCIGTAGGD